MEIVLVVVVALVILFLLVVVGKTKGPPDPSTQSDAWLQIKLESERAWINKYLRLPPDQQNESLKRMFENKTEYIRQIESQLTKRQMAHGLAAIAQELEPIGKRASELEAQGMSQEEAMGHALIEWKNVLPPDTQAPPITPTQEPVKPQVTRGLWKPAPSEREQKEKMRINLEKKRAEQEARARDIDVGSTLEAILLNLTKGDSLQQAITDISLLWSKEQKGAFLADIEQEKARGVLEPDAIRAALTKFSTR